jgi:hypothetical protein
MSRIIVKVELLTEPILELFVTIGFEHEFPVNYHRILTFMESITIWQILFPTLKSSLLDEQHIYVILFNELTYLAHLLIVAEVNFRVHLLHKFIVWFGVKFLQLLLIIATVYKSYECFVKQNIEYFRAVQVLLSN